jgi:hypothetical protein
MRNELFNFKVFRSFDETLLEVIGRQDSESEVGFYIRPSHWLETDQSVAAHQHHQGHPLRSLKQIWGSNKNLLRPLVALTFFVYYGKTI